LPNHRSKTQVAGQLTGGLEPIGIKQLKHESGSGDRTDAGNRLQIFKSFTMLWP
jgi:hypothetical protein